MKATVALGLAMLWQAGPQAARAPASFAAAAPPSAWFTEPLQRPLRLQGEESGQACAVLDGELFAHAAHRGGDDLRLFAVRPGGVAVETPFALTESGAPTPESETATILSQRVHAGSGARPGAPPGVLDATLELALPDRPYTAVRLDLAPRDFMGTVQVWGLPESSAPVDLGTFPIFDLSARHLGRSATLPLQEVAFRRLRLLLHLHHLEAASGWPSAPVLSVAVPPSREAQTLYTPVAEASPVRVGRNLLATFHVPAHVPIERVSIGLNPRSHVNFLRTVTVSARPDTAGDSEAADTVNGTVSRVSFPAGSFAPGFPALTMTSTDLEAVLAANLRSAGTVEVALSGPEAAAGAAAAPLPILSVTLAMRRRMICFDAQPGEDYLLAFGDGSLRPPVYPYAASFVQQSPFLSAVLGPERRNPVFRPARVRRPYLVRHPELLWTALALGLALLGASIKHNARASTARVSRERQPVAPS